MEQYSFLKYWRLIHRWNTLILRVWVISLFITHFNQFSHYLLFQFKRIKLVMMEQNSSMKHWSIIHHRNTLILRVCVTSLFITQFNQFLLIFHFNIENKIQESITQAKLITYIWKILQMEVYPILERYFGSVSWFNCDYTIDLHFHTLNAVHHWIAFEVYWNRILSLESLLYI